MWWMRRWLERKGGGDDYCPIGVGDEETQSLNLLCKDRYVHILVVYVYCTKLGMHPCAVSRNLATTFTCALN